MPFNSLFILIFFYSYELIYSSPPQCDTNKNFCENCNYITNICYKCEYPEIMVPDENGGCTGMKKCSSGKNYCLECDENGVLCEKCEINYYKDENGGCTYSEGCEISYKGECLKCKENFILIGKENDFKFCKSIYLENFKNCKEINYEKGNCAQCEEGFYLTSSDKKCTKMENCKESVFGNCISCDTSYYYNRELDKCELKPINLRFCKESKDGKNCEVCEDNFYFDDNGICIKTQYCSESDYYVCKKCKPGYYLTYNYVCTDTKECNVADEINSICTYCNINFYLDRIDCRCYPNEENGPYKYSKQVVNGESIECEFGYFLGGDSKCSNSEHCLESENGECKKCEADYHLGLDNICTNVDKCIYSNYTECIECEDGYYYDKNNNTCFEMTEEYLNCKYSCDYDNKCCECKKDFYLYQNDGLCHDNTENETFIKCAYVTSSDKCLKCEDGYFLASYDNKCCKVDKCKITQNENECLECEYLYCLDVKKQECVDNDLLYDINDKIYISCNRTNKEGTRCEQCVEGYQVTEEGYCVDIDYCEEKIDGKCVKCKDILSLNEYEFCANEMFGCLESFKDNCLRCNNLENLYECTECKEGYEKTPQGCIKYIK